jgi:hypothetical protein
MKESPVPLHSVALVVDESLPLIAHVGEIAPSISGCRFGAAQLSFIESVVVKNPDDSPSERGVVATSTLNLFRCDGGALDLKNNFFLIPRDVGDSSDLGEWALHGSLISGEAREEVPLRLEVGESFFMLGARSRRAEVVEVDLSMGTAARSKNLFTFGTEIGEPSLRFAGQNRIVFLIESVVLHLTLSFYKFRICQI